MISVASLSTALALADLAQKGVFLCNNWYVVAAVASNSVYVGDKLYHGVASLVNGKEQQRKQLSEQLAQECWIPCNIELAAKHDPRSADVDTIDNEFYGDEINKFFLVNNVREDKPSLSNEINNDDDNDDLRGLDQSLYQSTVEAL